MKQTNRTEREINNAIESVLATLSYGLARSIGRTVRGAFRMRGWQLIGFLAFIAASIIVYLHKGSYPYLVSVAEMPKWVKTVMFYLVLLMPVWYLMILGWIQDMLQKRYEKEFAAIGFKDREGKFPILLKKIKDKKGLKKSRKYKEIFIFRSNIPMEDWITAQKKIETAMNRNIIRFMEGGSKKVCRIMTVPPECRIPQRTDWNDSKIQKEDGMIVLGEGALEAIRFDLNRTPHVLAAGETGSGKSVILRACLWQLVKKGARVYMIDFKGGVEFGKRYERYGEVITERKRALEVLQELCRENEKRLALFREMEAKNLPEYNRKTGKNLCRIGVFCDEIAEMLDKKGAGKEEREIMEKLEGLVSSLARLSRATGINLFLGVQRPDANILTGQIKNNVPVRICGRFADKPASEIVLGNTDAVYLPDIKGRFLFRLGNVTEEFQAYYFDDDRDLVGEVPVPGEMLLQPKKSQEETWEACPLEKTVRTGFAQGGIEQEKREQSKKVAEKEAKRSDKEVEKAQKEARKAKQRMERISDQQEAFDFSWSCEKEEEE